MATINNAHCHRIENKGAVAPGYIADLLVVDDLHDLTIDTVIKNGKIIDMNSLHKVEKIEIPTRLCILSTSSQSPKKSCKFPERRATGKYY